MVIIIIVAAVILTAYVGFSFKILRPYEMGVWALFGRGYFFVDSGLVFAPLGISRVYKFPKGIMEFNFTVETAKTRNGKIKGYNNNKPIGPADVDIRCSFFTYFPRDRDLLKTLEFAPGRSAQEIGSVVVKYVIDVIRSVAGSLPWPLIDMERGKLIEFILAQIIPGRKYYSLEVDQNGFYFFSDKKKETGPDEKKMEKENPLYQMRLDLNRSSLNIEDANLSDEDLAKALDAPEKARLDAQVVKIKADAEQTKRTKEGLGAAEARQAMIKVIKENPDLELLFSLREMAQGTSNTIFYQIPKAFEDKMASLLGGNNVQDMLGKLKQEDWRKIAEEIAKLKK